MIPDAVREIQQGKMLILIDNPERENEADLYIPSDKVTPEIVTIMIKQAGGLICTAITKQQAHHLELPLMIDLLDNTEKTGVNFTVSVNAAKDITTGVSAYDRAKTIRILGDPASNPRDLTRPGHVFGLVAKNGGVLERTGHTEAAVDLARLAGLNPSGVLCEIVGESGRMANRKELFKLAEKLNISMVTIDDLTAYLKKNPLMPYENNSNIVRMASAKLPTRYGNFDLSIYKFLDSNLEHAVLQFGKIKNPLLTRIHSQCLTGDTFLSLRCDCGIQLHKSMKMIVKNGSGIIIYLNQEGRGIGLVNKIRAYALQDQGMDTVEANHALGFPTDKRDYAVAAEILKDMGVSEICLLTNNPDKQKQLISYGIRIAKTMPLETKPNTVNKKYLSAKKIKMGHTLKLV